MKRNVDVHVHRFYIAAFSAPEETFFVVVVGGGGGSGFRFLGT